MKFPNQNTATILDAKSRAVRAYRLMQWARWATFGLYMVAVFMLYVADVWGISSYIEKNSNEYVALAVFSVTSFILAYFLAASKEAVYEDIALSRSEGFKLTAGQKLAMLLFASSGVLFELFSATSNQQHISNNAAEQAGLLKPAEVGSVAINTPPALTDALMKARASLNNCQELVKQGRMKDCNVSEGKVAGAVQAITLSNQTAAAVSGEIVDKTNARNERLLERFDKPVFKAVGNVVGGDTNDGMVVAVAIMITIFEIQHIFSVFAFGNALRRMDADKLGKPPVQATEPEPQAAPASMLQKAGEAVAGEMMKAQGARNRVHDAMQKQADKLADKLDTASPAPSLANAPTPRMSVAETIRALVAGVRKSGAVDPGSVSQAVAVTYSGLFNPADFTPDDLQKIAAKISSDLKPAPVERPTAERGTSHEPAASSPPSGAAASAPFGSGEAVPFGSGEAADVKQREAVLKQREAADVKQREAVLKQREAADVKQREAAEKSLYQAWREAVKSGAISPAERPFVELARKFSNLDGVSNRELKPVWDSFLARGVGEGWLLDNPEFTEGSRKPRVILVA